MIVIKLGGSLASAGTLAACLATIARKYRGRAVVIVPGGGPFAEQVRLAQRQWRFDDTAAHRMALLAMQQMALLFNGLQPDWALVHSVVALRAQTAIAIWSPNPDELDHYGIPASWDITSDSLAAWLAEQLSARELILVKSAAFDAGARLAELAARGIVDKAFCTYAAANYRITLINQQTFNG